MGELQPCGKPPRSGACGPIAKMADATGNLIGHIQLQMIGMIGI